jgi:phosphomannomutase/phosphoglucomutase
MSIYKPCDIRGSAVRELTPELYRQWGRTLGQQVDPGAKFVVGGDVRSSTPEFLAALIDGLCEAGVDLVDLGTLPTPMVYYAKQRLAAAGCAIVTASHNPANVNGLKWMIGQSPPTEEDVRCLERAAGQRIGSLVPPTRSPAARTRSRKKTSRPVRRRPRSKPRTLDVSFDYVAWLQEVWMDTPPLARPIVLDTMHGAWSCRARRYLQAIFPRTLFFAIHDTPNGVFNGHSPDCSKPDRLEALAEAVYHERACLGIAFDGDGDRVAFVDNEGGLFSAEEATWVFLHSLAPGLAGERFVYDVKFSDRIPEVAARLGAEPLAERSGHAFIRSRMLQSRARFGAELSGHYFFRDLAGGDDGLFAACWMISHLAHRADRSVSELRLACPKVFMTPDLRVPMEAHQQPAVLDRVRRAWRGYPQTEIDGVRVSFPDGWALVRGSVTEPALTFRFEAGDWDGLGRLVQRFSKPLAEVGEALQARYHEAVGL